MNPVVFAVIVLIVLLVAFVFGLCSIAHRVDEDMPGYAEYVAEETRREFER